MPHIVATGVPSLTANIGCAVGAVVRTVHLVIADRLYCLRLHQRSTERA